MGWWGRRLNLPREPLENARIVVVARILTGSGDVACGGADVDTAALCVVQDHLRQLDGVGQVHRRYQRGTVLDQERLALDAGMGVVLELDTGGLLAILC